MAFELHGEIGGEDGGHPSALREAIVDVPENVAIDASGLTACPLHELQRKGSAAARRSCRSAIVGGGTARIGFASSEGVVKARLTLFNGGTAGGVTRLFVQSGVATPIPVPLVAVAEIRRVRSGLHATWTIPPILEGDGSLLGFEFTLKRRFTTSGEGRSYVSARCPGKSLRATIPKLVFRNEALAPGVAAQTLLKGGLSVPCVPLQSP